jgi:hypothetical protein
MYILAQALIEPKGIKLGSIDEKLSLGLLSLVSPSNVVDIRLQ